MKRILIFAIFTVALLAQSSGLQAAKYTWSSYDISFEVPDNGFVTYNSPRRFEIAWNDMSISVQLYSKEGSDDVTLKKNLNKTAAGYNIYDGKIEKIKFNGFKGFYLTGVMPDGTGAKFCNIVSSKNDLCLHIEINYIGGEDKKAMVIIKSFSEKQPIKQKEKPLKQKIQKKGAKPKPIKPTPALGELYDV